MPFYDYQCNECDHRFTVRQSFNDAHEAVCPKCDTEAERRFSTPAIVFKGSGFYVNDYGGKSASSSRESEPTPETTSDESSSDTTESDGGHKHPHEF
jgi:putative FmdB family regulatory protein